MACGSQVLDRPLSRFPLRGQAGCTAAPLRYGSGNAPALTEASSGGLGPVRKLDLD
jgi:hypothetical protein